MPHEILAPCGASFAAVFVECGARGERALLFAARIFALALLLLRLGQSSLFEGFFFLSGTMFRGRQLLSFAAA